MTHPAPSSRPRRALRPVAHVRLHGTALDEAWAGRGPRAEGRCGRVACAAERQAELVIEHLSRHRNQASRRSATWPGGAPSYEPELTAAYDERRRTDVLLPYAILRTG
jgi:hypothetical protein